MLFDYNSPSIVGNLMVMPDYPFAGVPIVVGPENPNITGNQADITINVGGNVDNT